MHVYCCAVAIGLAAGVAAFIADASLEAFNNWKFGTVKRVIREEGGFWVPYFAFIAFCLFFSFIAGCMVAFGAPTAAGSGIPEIKTYLNGVHIRGKGIHYSLQVACLHSCCQCCCSH